MNSIPQSQTAVEYDRSMKTWQAVNAKTIPTGPGPEGKRMARQVALTYDWPELARLIQSTCLSSRDDDQVTDLALDAADILQAGNVYQGEVESMSRPGLFHRVKFQGIPLGYDCTCEARRYHVIFVSGIGPICKHGLAQHLAYILGLILESASIPFQGEPVTVENFGDNWIDW